MYTVYNREIYHQNYRHITQIISKESHAKLTHKAKHVRVHNDHGLTVFLSCMLFAGPICHRSTIKREHKRHMDYKVKHILSPKLFHPLPCQTNNLSRGLNIPSIELLPPINSPCVPPFNKLQRLWVFSPAVGAAQRKSTPPSIQPLRLFMSLTNPSCVPMVPKILHTGLCSWSRPASA